MGVTIKRSFAPLTQQKLVTRADYEALGRLARERIIRRTVMGMGPDNEAFEPYSAAYAKQKGSSAVNLQVSGEMLRSIQVIAEDDRVTLTFPG